MRKAYALLGLAFVILFTGTWLLFERYSKSELTTSRSMENIFQLLSPAFDEGGTIPERYTCEAENISPPLAIDGTPKGAASLVLIMDDPDAPVGVWDHWVLYNIPPETTEILEGAIPIGAVMGKNSWGRNDYGGPCPPDSAHRYIFKLYALDTLLTLPPEAGKSELEQHMEGHIVGTTELTGRYDRPR